MILRTFHDSIKLAVHIHIINPFILGRKPRETGPDANYFRQICANAILLVEEVNETRRPHSCSRPCAFLEKTTIKRRHRAAPETHHEIHSSPVIATISKRRATKHAPRVSSYPPASIDPRFAEIGLVQLSQSVKYTNVTQTDRQDRD